MMRRAKSADTQAPRDHASPAARKQRRERAEALGLEMIETETRLRREKSARLRKLREAREGAASK